MLIQKWWTTTKRRIEYCEYKSGALRMAVKKQVVKTVVRFSETVEI